MNFVRIFADEDSLLTVQYSDESLDAFSKIFDQWTDIEFLFDFFSDNKKDLERPFWEGISIDQAIIETRKEAIQFRRLLYNASKKPPKERVLFFSRLFKSFDRKLEPEVLIKKKVYGIRNKTWLRIYALKVGNDMYIITGGAIKLTDNMLERKHTAKELTKLNFCRQFLLDEKIVDEEGLIELIEI